jgi:serine/threonine protein kinase
MSNLSRKPDSNDKLGPFLEILEEFRRQHANGENPDPHYFAKKIPGLEAELSEALSLMRRVSQPAVERTFRASDQERTSIASPPLQTLRQLTGHKLGNYELIRIVGEGAMGVVYEARDMILNKPVAIKITKNCELTELGSLRLKQEATIVASLQHDHIVPVFGFEEHGGYTYYIMQMIEGSSLSCFRDDPPSLLRRIQELEKSRERSTQTKKTEKWRSANKRNVEGKAYRAIELADEVAKIGYALAGALDYAHRRGVQHLDVKPSNILLDEKGKVWLTDFGLAEIHQTQTSEGNWVGTIGYMSPEMLGLMAPGRLGTSDIYSLGATLYCLISGRPPYEGDGEKYREWMIHGNVPSLQKLLPGIPRDLESIILKAINRDVSTRYQSAADFATDLDCYLKRLPITSQPIKLSDVTRKAIYRNRHTLMIVAGVAFLAMASFSYISWLYYKRAAVSEENYSELVTDLFRDLNEEGDFRKKGDPKSQYERLKLITDFLESRDKQGTLRENERFLLAQFQYYAAKQLAILKINVEEVSHRLSRSAELFTEHFAYSKDPIHRLDAARSFLFKAQHDINNNNRSGLTSAKEAIALVEKLNADYPDDLRFLDAIACYSRVLSDSHIAVKDYESAYKALDRSIAVSLKLQKLSPNRWWFYAFNECLANHAKISLLIAERNFEQVIIQSNALSARIEAVIDAMKKSGENYESMTLCRFSCRSAHLEALLALKKYEEALTELDDSISIHKKYLEELPDSLLGMECALSMLLDKVQVLRQLNYPDVDIEKAIARFEAALPADVQIRTRFMLYHPQADSSHYQRSLELLEKSNEKSEFSAYGFNTKLLALLLLDRIPEAVELRREMVRSNIRIGRFYEVLFKLKSGYPIEAQQELAAQLAKLPPLSFEDRAAMNTIKAELIKNGLVWNIP